MHNFADPQLALRASGGRGRGFIDTAAAMFRRGCERASMTNPAEAVGPPIVQAQRAGDVPAGADPKRAAILLLPWPDPRARRWRSDGGTAEQPAGVRRRNLVSGSRRSA